MSRAAIISWDHKTGQIALLASCAWDPTEGVEVQRLGQSVVRVAAALHSAGPVLIPCTEAGLVKLASFLQRISPIYASGEYAELPPFEIDRSGAPVHRYINPSPARGSGTKKRKISNEEILDLIEVLGAPDEV